MKFGKSGIARAPKRECWSRSSNNVGMTRILGFQHIVGEQSFSTSLIDNIGNHWDWYNRMTNIHEPISWVLKGWDQEVLLQFAWKTWFLVQYSILGPSFASPQLDSPAASCAQETFIAEVEVLRSEMMSCKLVVEGEFVSTEKMEEWGFSEYLYFDLFTSASR